MDKKLINEYGIADEIKKMRMINEYTFITKPSLDEEGEEDGQQSQQQQPPMDGGQQMPPQPDGGQQQGPAPAGQEQPQQMPPMDGGQGGPAPMPDNGPVDGVGTNVADDGSDAVADDGQTAQDGDEVVDVDDLTNAQASTEYKVDDMSSKVDRILNTVELMKTAFDINDEKLKELQQEIERRNPTPEEKLNIRSQSSYPYSTTPKDYWEGVNNDPTKNYDVTFDNKGNGEENKEDRKFDILAQDVDNLDLKKVSDSLDNMPSLNDYLGI